MEEYLGSVKMFAGNYAPFGWMYCDGSLLKISEHTTLYAVIGDQFGGDGRTTFAIPDLRGRVAVGTGKGIGTSQIILGQMGGVERVTLNINNMPSHNHTVACDMKSGTRALSNLPENNIPAKLTEGEGFGSDLSEGKHMNPEMISHSGNGNHHENMQPWLGISYIICTKGQFPPRH